MSPAIPGRRGGYLYPYAGVDGRADHHTQPSHQPRRIPDLAGALCADSLTPDLWFSDNLERRADAIAVCRTCPVTDQCLQRARDTDSRWGVWGGVNLSGRPVADCQLPGCDRPNIRHSPYCSSSCSDKAFRLRKRQEAMT